MAPVVRLGLTGGIGSGKSTVASLLAARGAAVVDADAIARELTAPNGLAMPMIADTFGQDFITSAGALDRDKMRALAYADPTARKRLESIIHPLVARETQSQALIAASDGRACIVFDIPLLVESPTWRQKVDHVLVVDCTPEVQVSRVMARSQLTRKVIEKIISSQAGREQRLGAADTVIFNVDVTLESLADEVRQISHRFGLSSK
ncbi:MAG: dephospho-CoA kinase [Rhodoferax sp.]|uniref:dephospho-CoA kinase n=1 Tax=Rhodoferax sp. TaxID=50421 RepID=UPI001859B74C|nr:dephospho-CoA kinase [Rhodoferax sp.]NMM12244.1 dephospho-CoA kinase [Rhodoferax sp.]NMM20203.1 dephospho-CoA kinase [Rhodoferax sp.]